MGFKSFLIQPYARFTAYKVREWMQQPIQAQDKILNSITGIAATTAFGKAHDFASVRNYSDFKKAVPLRDYEQSRNYIERVIEGEKNVTWPGLPKYFAKTSGTTSGTKYIPITRDSIGNHFFSAQTALLLFMQQTRAWEIMNGRMIFLSGSPELEKIGPAQIPCGRLSGIVNHQIPAYLRTNQLPGYTTNCIEDWEQKVDKIVEETIRQNMTLISGIPPWLQMYFDKLIQKAGKPVAEIFPNLKVLVHGGVNFEPYRARLENSVGKSLPTIETYPASEGFFAYQDTPQWQGLLLNADSGIFFEFVKAENIFENNPERLSLREVETGVNYALVISSNAGLWGYVIGDTLKFLSLNPYRIAVTGRISQYISAFGEHVIVEEVEQALQNTLKIHPAQVTEFTVAPQVQPPTGELPCHEWFIEFEKMPDNLVAFTAELNQQMSLKNSYYDDLIRGKVLQPLKVYSLKKHAFIELMKEAGKLGGQNKVPRIANGREIAEKLKIN